MGADLLLTVLAHNRHRKLNWAAGRKVARTMDPDTLLRGAEEAWGITDSVTEARQTLNTAITALKQELAVTQSRDAYSWDVSQWRIHIRGGTSWGDDPSDGYTVFSDIQSFPQVLKAIGFREDAVKYADVSAAA